MAKKAGATPREIAWIEALAASYEGKDTLERRRKYVRDLESLVQDDPNDVEAKAFLVFQIWKNGSWMTESKKQLPISSHQAVDALLDQILAGQSDAPGPSLSHSPVGRREAGPGAGFGVAVRSNVAHDRPHVAHAGPHLFRSCSAMPTRPGSRKPRRGSITPT